MSMRRQLRARKLSMESSDRNNNNNSGSGFSSEDTYLSSDAADCSVLPPPMMSSTHNGTSSKHSPSSPAAASAGDDVNHFLISRKKWKGGSSDASPSPMHKNSPKTTTTLFSTVMSLSNNTNPAPQDEEDDDDDDADNEGPCAATSRTSFNNATTSNGITTTTTSSETKMINTTTPQKPSNGKSNNLPKSPLFSPGGYEILRALDSANLYAYQEHYETGENDVLESDDDEDGRLAEEWQDATIYFNGEDDVHNNNDIENAKTTEDLTDSINDPLHYSSIVEATKHASDFVDIQQCMKKRYHLTTIPEPMGVGVLDWSLKRRLRLECVPGRCLPQSLLPSSSSSDEGYLHQLALRYLSCSDVSGVTSWSQQRHSCSRDVAMAKWLASIMYYQHPAVHPLPSSMLLLLSSSKDSGASTDMVGISKRDLSSFIVGPNSIQNQVRLPAAGCMGGLGISAPPDKIEKGVQLGKQDRRSNNDKSSIATESSLLHQRRRDWQEAFRSMFHCWKSKLKRLQESRDDIWSQIESGSSTTQDDDVSRCSFYAILSHQVILFRGGYVDSGNADHLRKLRDERNNPCSADAASQQRIVPMIVFSSTTACLRSKLKSMGVDLRICTQKKHANVDHERRDCEVLFSESLLDTGNRIAPGEVGDTESIQSDLDVMKLENNDKEQVRVEVKKRNHQHQKVGKSGSVEFPPLFVYGDDDCATVYELLLNTYGLSVGLETKLSKGGSSEPVSSPDVPLLLCRSLGPCMHTTLRTLSYSSRRDGGYLNQMQTNASNFTSQRDNNYSTSKAALELRGPILPCALRDMTCAVMNFMMLDKYTHMNTDDQLPIMYDESDPDTAASTHQFLMSLQAHEGECSTSSAAKSTGSSSSTEFNGLFPLLTPRQHENQSTTVVGTTTWSQCRHGECLDKLVWDISRKSVVSFHTFAATS